MLVRLGTVALNPCDPCSCGAAVPLIPVQGGCRGPWGNYLMANNSFNDLFKIYPNKNAELRSVAHSAYEYGKTIALEPSAAMSQGLDDYAIARQRSYLAQLQGMVDAMAAKPVPDMPAVHPTLFNVDVSTPYQTFFQDVADAKVPLNEQTKLLSEHYMIFVVELCKSQSATQAGSLLSFDVERATANIATMMKLIDEIEARSPVDLPETATPEAQLGETTEGHGLG